LTLPWGPIDLFWPRHSRQFLRRLNLWKCILPTLDLGKDLVRSLSYRDPIRAVE